MVRWEEMLPWYPGRWISDDGRIYSSLCERELKQFTNRNGYHTITMWRQGRQHLVYVNRVVCWHFNGPFPSDGIIYDAAHLDCDPGNNNYWNLEWQTHRQNQNHPITRRRISDGVILAARTAVLRRLR